jgi:chloride channel, nucleotide-sensitive, 1A
MEILREAPKAASFVPLSEHQSRTPASFYSGPPVLHYYSDRSKLVVLDHEAHLIPALAPLLEHATSTPDIQGDTNGDGDANGHVIGEQKTIQDLDVYVTSDKLLLFSNTLNIGVSIEYPSISLHAIQSLPQPSATEQQGLYMQIIARAPENSADEEPESISLTVIPTAAAPPAAQTSSTVEGDLEVEAEGQASQSPVVAMFNALSACSNLHPDPVEPGDEDEEGIQGSRLFQAGLAFPGASDGSMPPAMPGSGGWITAENMHEFVDEHGNWIGGDDNGEGEEADGEGGDEGPLGPGAGTVRERDDEEHVDGDAANDGDETKWRRTS